MFERILQQRFYTHSAVSLGDLNPDGRGSITALNSITVAGCGTNVRSIAMYQWSCSSDDKTESTGNATVEDSGSMNNGSMGNDTKESSGLRLELGGWSGLTMGRSVMGLLLSTVLAL